MPAVELERLEIEIQDILRFITDPSRTCKGILVVLEFYGQGSTTTTQTVKSLDPTISFGTPLPVIRELQRSLRNRLSDDSELAFEIAQQLWGTNRREARLIAIALLPDSSSGPSLSRLDEWSRESKELEVLKELASRWMRVLLQRDPLVAIQRTRERMQEGQASNVIFGALALQAAVVAPSFEDLPPIFRIIEPLLKSAKGDLLFVLEDILVALARRTPQETTRFLLDRLVQEPAATRRILRRILDDFPERQRKTLQESLTG